MQGERIFTIQNQDAGFACIWGAYALFSPEMFSRNPMLYAPMIALAPQVFWGLLFVVCGLSAYLLSYYNRRKTASFLLGAVYLFFAVMYFDGDTRSPGGALYLWLGGFNIFFTLGGWIWTRPSR